jgi:hypothetical protein
LPGFEMAHPFDGKPYTVYAAFGSKQGEQIDLGGDQGQGHSGIDLIPTDEGHNQVFAPVSGQIMSYQPSTGTITVRSVSDANGVSYPNLEVQIVHVSQDRLGAGGEYFEVYSRIAAGSLLTHFGDIGYTGGIPHLHIAFKLYENDGYSGGRVFYDPGPSLP